MACKGGKVERKADAKEKAAAKESNCKEKNSKWKN